MLKEGATIDGLHHAKKNTFSYTKYIGFHKWYSVEYSITVAKIQSITICYTGYDAV